MAHRGERVISRKAIAQGMSDVLRCPVCSCAHFLCTLRMRPRVQRASGIPCALCFRRGGENNLQTSDAMRRENENLCLSSLRGALATKQSTLTLPHYGLLRFARNDEEGAASASRPPVGSQ